MFSFNSVANNFDEHISKSIESYNTLSKNVISLADFFVVNNTNIVDIGSSTGKLLHSLKQRYVDCGIKFTGYECEHSFHEHYNVDICIKQDALSYNENNVCFCTCLFTLQFLPYCKRMELLDKIHKSLIAGGGFVIAEKIHCESFFDRVFQEILMEDKRKYFTDADLLDKNLSLRTMMRTVSNNEMLSMLVTAGFIDIEVFYKDKAFTGYVCRKGVL